MSSVSFEELLREAMVDLSEMQEQDGQCVGRKVGQNKRDDHAYFLHHWSAMYLRYMQISKKLERVHDQILQPQKRYDVRVLLDSCIGRMLEMKFKIVQYCGEYVNLNEALVDLKLTPEALEIPIPSYFIEDRSSEITERRRYIQTLINHYRTTEADAPVTVALASAETATAGVMSANDFPMSVEQAVLVLQTNERGRQGRQRAKFHRTIYEQEMHQHREFEYGTSTGKDQAATRIQKIVLGYLARKRAKKILQEEMEFLGMEASSQVRSSNQQSRLTKTLAERKTKQFSNLAELQQEAKEMRSKIKVQEGGKKMETMLDEILTRMANIRLESADDTLPVLPSEEEGGSLAFLGRLPKSADEDEARKKAEEEAAAAAAAGAKKAPPKKDAKGGGKKGEEEVEALPTLAPSLFWDRFSGARERYANVWHQTFQKTYFEDRDLDQHLDKELLHQEILDGAGGVEHELRRCVDQLVMVEVNNLRERMEREKGGKKKKGKGKNKKPKKIKVKDPTDGTKLETFFNSAVYLNILQPSNESVRLSDYIGAHDMMGNVMLEHQKLQAEQVDQIKVKWQAVLDKWDDYAEQSLRMKKEQFELLFKNYCDQSSWMFEPSAAQVRQAVTEYCILPLGSQVIHDSAPHHTACLLYGFPKTGKTMLTHAICNETGANLFNLSPATFNPGGGAQKMIQMVFRIARSLAPSIIYIDQVEKIFGGKGKKKKKGDPVAARAAKMKKDIVNGIKELEPTDRVMVIANSSAPWDADLKELCNNFKAMVCCVHPDYASRMELWQTLIQRKGAALPTYHDYEVLAYMTNKYTSGVIAQVIEETLTERRVKRLSQRPLRADEFLPALSRASPIFREDYASMKEFVMKLPLTARRVTEDDFKEAEAVDPKAKGKPAAKPGGKKK